MAAGVPDGAPIVGRPDSRNWLRVAAGLDLVGWAVAGWMVFGPPSLISLTLCALLPLAAWALYEQGGEALLVGRRGGKRTTTIHVIMPPLAAAVAFASRAVRDVEPMRQADLAPVILGAAVVGAVVFLILFRRNGLRGVALFGGLMFGAFYLGGLYLLLDARLDIAPTRDFKATVLDKREIGTSRSRTQVLDLAPWGEPVQAGDIEVAYPVYQQARIGGQVCIKVHKGALGVAWRDTIVC